MAEFEKKKHAQDEFNNGNKYVANDGVQPATINNLVENSLYTEAFAESLASTPDTTNVAQVGIPSVELVDNPSAGITGAKKFKFSNLKGEKGHSYFRAATSLATTATSVSSSSIAWGTSTEALISDSIVDNNGNVFAVTARTAATAPTIPILYRTSIRGTAGTDGTDGDSVFIRYSASSNGSNMTAVPAEDTHYIGFYRGQSASNTASDYTWSQYVGKEISEVAIDEFSFVITYDDGTTSTAPLNTENCLLTYAVPSDEATAMTAYLVPSNADLNDYRGENYWGKTFYAGGNNTVQNIPIAGTAFSLEVLRSGAFATTQRITTMAEGSNNKPTVYTRSVADSTATSADGTWTAWTEVAEANGTYPDMTVGKAQSDENGNGLMSHATRNELLNGTASYDFNDYIKWGHYELQGMSGTPLVNAPTSTSNPSATNANWYLDVYRRDSVYATQIAYSARSDGAIAIRVLSNNSWGSWRVVIDSGTVPNATNATHATTAAMANTLAESGHKTLLWSGTCSSGSSISVSGLSNYSALYIKANSDSAEEYVMLTKGAVGLYPSLYSGNKMTIVPGVDTYWFVELFNISVSGSTATFNFDLLTLDISSTTIQKQQQSAAITLTEIYGIESFKI